VHPLLFIMNNTCLLIFSWVVSHKGIRENSHLRFLEVGTVYMLSVFLEVVVASMILMRLTLTTLTVMSVSLFCVALIILLKRPIPVHSIERIQLKSLFFSRNPYIHLIHLSVAAAMLFKLMNVLLLVPYGYDSTSYHLPVLVDYIQSERFYLPDQLMWANAYPKNVEFLNLWMLIFFRNGILLKFVQYSITVMGAAAVYSILAEERIQWDYARLGALLYLATPIVLAQMSTAYVDTALSSIMIWSIYFLSRYAKWRRKSDMIYFALLSGFFLGIKYSGIGYYAIFIGVFLLVQLFNSENLYTIFKKTLYVGLAGFVLGGFWYILNFINFQNPIWPFELKLLGTTIFQGDDMNQLIMYGNTPYAIRHKAKWLKILISWVGIGSNSFGPDHLANYHYNFFKDRLITAYDQRIGGFGFQWILLFVPSFVIWSGKSLFKRRISKSMLIITGTLTACFLITPANWWGRYVSFIVTIGIFGFISLISHTKKKNTTLFLLSGLVLLSCYQGSAFELKLDKQVLMSYLNNQERSIRSVYVQTGRMDLREIMKRINNPKGSYDILCFGANVIGDLYYYQGDFTQNRVKYFYQGNRAIKNYGINTFEKFSRILKENRGDFILISTEYKDKMDQYSMLKKEYKLIYEGDFGIYLYERTKQ